MERPEFTFTGAILQEEPGYTSLCPELDVASQGQTVQQARDALLEAVTLYLETALENNLPWLRPIPRGNRSVGCQNGIMRYTCGYDRAAATPRYIC